MGASVSPCFEEKFAEEEKEAEFLASLRDENRAAAG